MHNPAATAQSLQQAMQLHRDGRLSEAEVIYRQILAQDPQQPDALHLLGAIALECGHPEAAVQLISHAIKLLPLRDDFYFNLGSAYDDFGNATNAIAAYQQSLALNPRNPEAFDNLGNVFRKTGRFDQAIAAYRQALAFRPEFAKAHNNIAVALKEIGQLDEALTHFQQAVWLDPTHAPARSNLIFTLNAHPDRGPAAAKEEAIRWNERHASMFAAHIQPHANDRNPDRPLRVGYVSANLHEHSVAYFLEPIFRCADASAVSNFAYALQYHADQTTERLKSYSVQWRNVTKLTDDQIAAQIRADQIDILVDLAGHTGDSLLTVFARKPAPIQVTYLGYPGTTGLDAIDYRLSDAYADPPGEGDSLYVEKIVRLPESAWCYQPPQASPPVAYPTRDHIQFGCFGAMQKIAADVIATWSEILRSVPASRLVLKNAAIANESVRTGLIGQFASHQIDANRLVLLARDNTIDAHLARYAEIDIALDTFPYNGTTTTCEALWMGVPVLTFGGRSHISRVGVSLLSNAGMNDWIAPTREEYVARAIAYAQRPDDLLELRITLRDRLQLSTLMNAAKFTKNLEFTYRQLWLTWCAQSPI